MPNYHIPVFPDKIYHVFSRAVGSEKLFKEEENYRYFLEQFQHKVGPVAELLAYCLIPNHFHFLVRIKPESEIKFHFEMVKWSKIYQSEICPDFILERFSNWLNGYTKSFNNLYKRKGSLFIDYIRRVEIEDDGQFSAIIFYIHKNPVHHGLTKDLHAWRWSSYPAFLSSSPTQLPRKEIIDWFGSRESFIQFHQQPIDLKHNGEME
jgi:REP element-mobilizing transposase RayT